jgi:hypothetical protein
MDERRTVTTHIEITREQQHCAATMREIARQSRSTCAEMARSAQRMETTARAAIVDARRQLLRGGVAQK